MSGKLRLFDTRFVAAAAVLSVACGTAQTVIAQTYRPYRIEHDIDIDFSVINSTYIPDVWMQFNCVAVARSGWCRDRDEEDRFRYPITTLNPVIHTASAYSDSSHLGSRASASAEVDLDQQSAGRVFGKYKAYGASNAIKDGCFVNLTTNARARSSCKVVARTEIPVGMLPSGKIVYGGLWTDERRIRGTTRPKLAIDPIYARLIDDNAQVRGSWKLMDVRSEVVDGRVTWGYVGDFRVLEGDGRHYSVVVEVGGAVVDPADEGMIKVRCENGQIMESYAFGQFQHLADGNPNNGELPTVGDIGVWQVPLPEVAVNYTLTPADAGWSVEIECGSGGHDEADEGLLCEERPGYLTGIGDGCMGLNTSTLQSPLTVMGYEVSDGMYHLMEFCEAPGGQDTQLEVMSWPVYQESDDSQLPPDAVYVRVWDESPLNGGQVIAGNLSTNRLLDGDLLGSGVFRTVAGDLENCTRPIRDLLLDMSWVPPLPAGQTYGFEVVVKGAAGSPPMQSPAAPYPDLPAQLRPALQYDVSTAQWSELFDHSVGVQVPMMLWGDPVSCAGDFNGDDTVNTMDVLDFLNAWAGGDDTGDFNGDGTINTLDMLEFLNAWVSCR